MQHGYSLADCAVAIDYPANKFFIVQPLSDAQFMKKNQYGVSIVQ